ncbi:VWA domain-containing protein [Nocardia sp. NPDC050712]|uniref:vWA domain-containing protein n=1 Tax=Nocardia sp. NPDC050712 TaxID=3155518 RepID=UPI0033FD207C
MKARDAERYRWHRLVAALTTVAAVASLVGCGTDTPPSTQPGSPSASVTSAEPSPSPRAEPTPGSLLIVMDSSGSMNESLPTGGTRLDAAKNALRQLVGDLPEDARAGLRVFGDKVPNTDRERGCRDTTLIAPVAPLDRQSMLSAIDGYQATGFTPIGYSLREAASDLPKDGPRSIILVTDGEDTCAPPDPCETVRDLKREGFDVTVHTVGFALSDNKIARDQLSCIATTTGGEFHDVTDGLDRTLIDIATRQMRAFRAQGQPLAGKFTQREANTGTLGTRYVDTIQMGDRHYYRFPVPPGSRIGATVYTAAEPDAPSSVLLCLTASLVDAGGGSISSGPGGGDNAYNSQVDSVAPKIINAAEVWLSIAASSCRGAGRGEWKFRVEFTVDTPTRQANTPKVTQPPIEGAPVPRDAATGTVGLRHTDTIISGEANYYRFEVKPGETVGANVLTMGNPKKGRSSVLCVTASLVDENDNAYQRSSGAGEDTDENQVDDIAPVAVNADQVWLKIDADDCRNGGDSSISFPVEFTVR